MSTISLIFNEILYRPLFNGLVFLYNVIPGSDLGVAIIILTIVIRLILYPLFQKGIKSQKEMALIQPKIKEVQKKYKNDKEKQARAVMELYKEHKINPMSGCLPLLIQLPILLAVFKVLAAGFDASKLDLLYSFVANPGSLNSLFLNIFDLAQASIITKPSFAMKPGIILAILAGASQFIQGKIMAPPSIKKMNENENDFASAMNKQMLYLMPVIVFFAGLSLPAGLPLYWTTLNVFGIMQQYLTNRNKKAI
jgi:YidC/Oxa1 family membrane protein insertase